LPGCIPEPTESAGTICPAETALAIDGRAIHQDDGGSIALSRRRNTQIAAGD